MPLHIGIDIGTSGCRAVALDESEVPVGSAQVPLPEPERMPGGRVQQDPNLWWNALQELLDELFRQIDGHAVAAVGLDATSGTVLLADPAGEALGPALMYNDNRAVAEAERVAAIAPPSSAAHGTGSGLAKLLWLLERQGTLHVRACTQADWLNWRLSGAWFSDANNSLKSGWDAEAKCWPEWLDALGVPRNILPPVRTPGAPAATLRPELCARWGLPASVVLAAGTTDSTAAIIATGAAAPGDAVTSLGSTLVTKVVVDRPIAVPEYGIYSQPLGDLWLVGGGSNTGGAVLRAFFSDTELAQLSREIDPEHPVSLDYYPLLAPGERFPVNDPRLSPRLEPRPADDRRFLQGLLESIARIERDGYRRLAELGAPYPRRVFTVGGGAANPVWGRIRGRLLGVRLEKPRHSEAAYGAAMLARRSVSAG